MNRALFRCAGIALALVAPLLMASCQSHEKKGAPQAYQAGECPGCTAFRVRIWRVSADKNGLAELLRFKQNDSLESLNSGTPKIIMSADAEAIAQRLQHDSRAAFVSEARGVTPAGEPIPFSVSTATGTYSGLLMAGPQPHKLPSRVVKFSLFCTVSYPGSQLPEDTTSENGRVMLKDGLTVVSVQAVRNGWLVWFTETKFSA
ncbi:hypothetical protein [Pantoea sp. Pa-EAmG]|uniref:hypothetical protein n=1 Tax=Pantoea sp. Pa-EAmG TaxID=3043311 RepID=UPI0024AF6320|nr:hypothetical protein [Pantoea sp. Pa-EAmG]MDI6955845.1 hypothetical protein [Pantoea sp. Pa-EAmG]